MPLSTLQATPRDASCKTEGQDGVAVSFLVGLFHSLQHAGLSRRTLSNAASSTGQMKQHLKDSSARDTRIVNAPSSGDNNRHELDHHICRGTFYPVA
jgi:hypothetical protein